MTAVHPLPEHAEKPWHWLRAADSRYFVQPFGWSQGRWTCGNMSYSPERAAELGWSYYGPCEPPPYGWGERGA